MSHLTQTDPQPGAEPTPLPEIQRTPVKKSGELQAPSTIPAKAAGVATVPKKPAKKVVKSWPSVNALITALSLTATLGGWAHFTVQEMRRAEADAAAWAASQAVVAPAAPASAEIAPPIPTVVPAQTFNIHLSASVNTVTGVPAAASAAPGVAQAVPVLRSVSAPPPPVVSVPVPAASTSSSR